MAGTAFRQMLEADLSQGSVPAVEEIEIPHAERKTLQQLTLSTTGTWAEMGVERSRVAM